MPCGSGLLVGVGGSGRRSLTKLASTIQGNAFFQPEISKNYCMYKTIVHIFLIEVIPSFVLWNCIIFVLCNAGNSQLSGVMEERKVTDYPKGLNKSSQNMVQNGFNVNFFS
jgi:hypothetical protein